MDTLIRLLEDNQTFLVRRILRYAKIHHFTKYTSTLEEAWILSVSGLTNAIVLALSRFQQIPEIDLEQDAQYSAVSAFGVLEAKRHRNRGITLEMFLGLMKYYRQSYLDLITETVFIPEQRSLFSAWIQRFFDHTELAFCREWYSRSHEELVRDLQDTNRELTNTKNKYLTIFESIPTPIIITDAEDRLVNLNFAAQHLVRDASYAPGHLYYSGPGEREKIHDVFPWLEREYNDFIGKEALEAQTEMEYLSSSGERRNIVIHFQRILDFSQKFSGAVIFLIDMTERTRMEEQLRYMSYHDPMTGLYNRAYFEQELVRAAAGRYNPFGVVSCDIDGLKLVNDKLGHSAGDALIRTIGRILTDCFRKSDVVARVGGDEFVALMPGSDLETVRMACRRIVQNIEKHNQLLPRQPVSLSAGGAVGNVADCRDIRMLIEQADAKMYEEKQKNKARYVSLLSQRFEEFGEELFFNPNESENPPDAQEETGTD